MLNDEAIEGLARFYANIETSNTGSATDYFQGYKQCQKTIPSECMAFVEWIVINQYYKTPDGTWVGPSGRPTANNLKDLFNIYQEQTKKL